MLIVTLAAAPCWAAGQQTSQATPPGTAAQQESNAVGMGVHPAEARTTAGMAGTAAAEAPSSAGSFAPAAPEVLGITQPSEWPRAAALEMPVTLAAEAPARRQIRHIPSEYDVTKIGDRKVGKGLDFYSYAREQQLGRQLATQVEQDSRLVRDVKIQEYINRIGQRLVRNSDAKVPFTIKVIDNDEVNAFALPGGFFYVNTGLILAADNEAQLAGVMAHEIAHVAARDATRNATRSELFNLASIPLIFFGGPVGLVARQAMAVAVPMSFLKFSRDDERRADLLGLEYQYASGYDPEEFVRFFEKLKLREKRKHNFLAKAFATHPMTSDRIKAAQKEIAEYLPAKSEYIVDTSEFEAMKARLERIENAQRIELGHTARPVLRRRQPRTPDIGSDEHPPKLERRSKN